MTRDRLLGKVFVAPCGTAIRVIALDSVENDRVRVALDGQGTWIRGDEFRRMVAQGLLVESERVAA